MKTDSQLQKDVNAELEWEPSIHAEHIGVEVKQGVITLAGEVESYAEKWKAERAALRVSGVRALTTELKVRIPGLSQRTDADIAAAVENVLGWTSSLPEGAVKVMVEAGWVTLTGAVESHYQRQAATDAVRTLLGVTGVSDQIGIKPSVTAVAATAVKADIEAALKRTSIADAQNISVAVHGQDVTLSGTVQSWNERDTANNSAWGTPGVRNVVDLMMMA
jgi:osmotically-inducible protein OsmY